MTCKLLRAFTNPRDSFRYIVFKLPFLPDRIRIHMMWKQWMDYPLNLHHLRTFNEKLQWMKLYYRNPLYTKLVDKYAVKDYVKDVIGEQYIIPTLAVWNSVDDIDISKLPDQFVLKTTHDSGGGYAFAKQNNPLI